MTNHDIVLKEKERYPIVKKVRLKEVFSKDTLTAILLFIALQLVILFITLSMASKDADRMIMLTAATLVGVALIMKSLEIINKRQMERNAPKVKISIIFLSFIGAFLGLIIITAIIKALNLDITQQANQNAALSLLKNGGFPAILTFAIVAPIVEELVFRELLPSSFGRSIISFIAVTLLFILLHHPTGITGLISYIIPASAFLFARLKSDNVHTAIIVHILWNAAVLAAAFAAHT